MSSDDENYIILYRVVNQLNKNIVLLGNRLSLRANQLRLSQPVFNLLNYGYKICYRFHHLRLPFIRQNSLFYNRHILLHLLLSVNKKKKIRPRLKYIKFNGVPITQSQKEDVPEISQDYYVDSQNEYEEETKISETRVEKYLLYDFNNLTSFSTKSLQLNYIPILDRILFKIKRKLLASSPVAETLRQIQDNYAIQRDTVYTYSTNKILFSQFNKLRQIIYLPSIKKSSPIISLRGDLLDAKKTELPLMIIQYQLMKLPFQDSQSSRMKLNLTRKTISLLPLLSLPSSVFQIATKYFVFKNRYFVFKNRYFVLQNRSNNVPDDLQLFVDQDNPHNISSISVSSRFGIQNEFFYDISEDENILSNKFLSNNIRRLAANLPRFLRNSIETKIETTENKLVSTDYPLSKYSYRMDFLDKVFFNYIDVFRPLFDGVYFSKIKSTEMKKLDINFITKPFNYPFTFFRNAIVDNNIVQFVRLGFNGYRQDIKKLSAIFVVQSLKRIHLHREANNQVMHIHDKFLSRNDITSSLRSHVIARNVFKIPKSESFRSSFNILNNDVPLEIHFDDGYQDKNNRWARDYYNSTSKYSQNKFSIENDFLDHHSLPRTLAREYAGDTFSAFSFSSRNIVEILNQDLQKYIIPIPRFGNDLLIYSLDSDQITLKLNNHFEKTLINLAKEMRRYGY